MENNARVLNYYNHGTAAPTIRAMVEAENKRAQAAEAKASEDRARTLQRERAEAKAQAKALSKVRAKAETKAQTKVRTKNHANANTQTRALPKAQTKQKTQAKSKVVPVLEAKTAPGISVFAVLGTVFVAILMVFVVLAQINFNETAAESVRLNVLINDLSSRHRELELSFESAVDIKEVERFTRDELGMSRPDSNHVILINSSPRDTAIIMSSTEERSIQGFGYFLRSLTEYFRR